MILRGLLVATAALSPPAVARDIQLNPCCKQGAPGPLQVRLGAARLSVQSNGAPFAPGHPDDVSYWGRTPWRRSAPKSYGFTPLSTPLSTPLRITLRLGQELPKVVRLGAKRSQQQHQQQLLHNVLAGLLGPNLLLSRLGGGGHQTAWKACKISKKATGMCVVAKIRKHGAGGLRRDIALFRVAKLVTARATLRTQAGTPSPVRIYSAVVHPTQPDKVPAGRFVRVARLLQPEALAAGVVVQELVAFHPSASLLATLAKFQGYDGPLRERAWLEAGKVGVNRVRVLGFLDRYPTVSRIGPEVIHLASFVSDCALLSKVPTIAALCRQVRTEFCVPDDFLDRVAALEQLYRDSAGAVIRFQRANFKDAVGNVGVDGAVREVGLDYNHGRNVGWDPVTLQFVIFDV